MEKIHAGKISFFENPITNIVPSGVLSLLEVHGFIREVLQDQTSQIRIPDKRTSAELKRKILPYVTFSGTFESRQDKRLVDHSNLVCIDIDGLDNPIEIKEKLKLDPFVGLLFISPSGNGVKAVFGMDIKSHSQLAWYQALTRYLETTYSIKIGKIDSSCSNISRACFLAHDPEAYLSTNWEVGLPLLPDIYFQKSQEMTLKSEDSYESYEPYEDHEGKLDFTDRNTEDNFRCLININVGAVGIFGSPREPWIQKLACRCNKFGMNKDTCLHYVLKYFEHHPVSTNPAKPIDVKKYIHDPIEDSYKRYEDDFGTWPQRVGNDEKEFSSELLTPGIFTSLPPIFNEIVSPFEGNERDVVFLSSLALLSVLVTGVYGIYDQKILPNLFIFVTANAAGGKGKANYSRRLVSKIEDYLGSEYESKYQDYLTLLDQFQEGKVKERPIEPKRTRLFLPGNTSSAAFYKALAENKNNGTIVFESEADTLLTAIGQEWGNFSDLLRKAYHNEPADYLRVSVGSSGYIPETNVAVFLSGTPNQFMRTFPNIENGLFSRFMIYSFNSAIGWKDMFRKDATEMEELIERVATKLLSMYQVFATKSITIPPFRLTESQHTKFQEFFRRMYDKYTNLFGEMIDASIKRLATSAFKIAMILSAVRNYDVINNSKWDGVCTDEDLETTLFLIDSLIKHTATVIQFLPNYRMLKSKNINPSALNYLKHLPDKFGRKLADGIARSLNIKLKTAESYLKKLEIAQLLKHEHNKYEKMG